MAVAACRARFAAADEAQVATAREAMRQALAWESIGGDPRQNTAAGTGQITPASYASP
jgi:hypothetical protein